MPQNVSLKRIPIGVFIQAVKVGRRITSFPVILNPDNYISIKYNQINQKKKLIKIFREYQKKGIITSKSIAKPTTKNLKMRKKLKELITANRTLTRTLNFLKRYDPIQTGV